MNDTQLLASPDWARFTDRQLRRAITLAKIQGRTAYNLYAARAEEQGGKIRPPSLDLYARHCILAAPDGKDLWNQWDGQRIVDLIADPRLYWFCTLYNRGYRKHLAMEPLSRSIPFLTLRANHACKQYETIRNTLAVKAFLASINGTASTGSSAAPLEELQKLHDAALDYSMLALMELQSRMDVFVGH